jgi:hypothetical protein
MIPVGIIPISKGKTVTIDNIEKKANFAKSPLSNGLSLSACKSIIIFRFQKDD